MRPLAPRDLLGNRFTAVVRGLSAEEATTIPSQLARLERIGWAYLPRGARPLLVFPGETTAGQADRDDAAPGRYKLTVSFVLPPGSYATLLLKGIAGSSEQRAGGEQRGTQDGARSTVSCEKGI